MHLQLASAPHLCRADGTVLPLALRDAALLTWLVLEGPTPRTRLAQVMWPASTPEAARNTLRQRLFQLRKHAGADLITGTSLLALAEGVAHDLGDAHGVLEPHTLDLGPEFDTWLAQQRARRSARTRQTLADLADMAERARDWPDALSHARELLALQPLAEDAHRRLMRLHYLAGDRAAAILAFDACEQLLKHEVGARPSAETLALLASIERSSVAAPPPSLAEAVPASVLRPPRMVGRSTELAALAQGWAAAQVVAVNAEAGTGKSRLLQEFAATRPGVAHVAARPGDAGVPFATLARLLRTVVGRPQEAAQSAVLALEAGTRSAVARVVPELGGSEPLNLSAPGGPGPVGSGQRQALQRAVAELLAAQPGLEGLLVDDLHFADEASLDMLLTLAADDPHASGAQPRATLRWALAYRPAEAGTPLRVFVDALSDQAVLRPLPLQPLGLAGLAALVDSLGLPGIDGAALAPGLLRRTGGNPLFVLETIKQAWVERKLAQLADAQLMPRPQSVGRLIERRVLQLSPGALAVARVAAIAGVDFCVALAEHVLQVPAMALADAIAELDTAQVMRGDAFAHDLVADAVQGSVPPTVAEHTHAQVAQWLEAHHGEPARVGRHWVAAGQPLRALPALRAAADAARLALRGREQVAFLLEVSRIEEDLGNPDAAFETVHALLEARIDVDRHPIGWALCDRLDALARSPAQRGRALQQRGWFALNRGELAQALQAAQALLPLAQAQADSLLAADAWHLQALALSLQAQDEAALAAIQQARDGLLQAGSPRARSEFLGTYGMVLDNCGQHEAAQAQHRRAIALATEIGYAAQAVVVSSNLALSLRRSGLLQHALEQLRQAERLRGLHDQLDGPAVNTLPAMALVLTELGQHGQALQWCDRAEAHLAQHSPAWLGVVHNHRALCWVQLGQWARATQALRLSAQCSDKAPGWLAAVRHLHEARLARYSLPGAEGPAQALAALQAGGQRVSRSGRGAALWQALELERCALLPPEDAYPLAQELAAQALAMGHYGVVAAATARAAASGALLWQRGQLPDAAGPLRLAERAQGLLAAYQANDVHADEVRLNLLRALQAVAPAGAARALAQQCAADLQQRAKAEVPEAYRDGFLQRHPVHRTLLALAARLVAT